MYYTYKHRSNWNTDPYKIKNRLRDTYFDCHHCTVLLFFVRFDSLSTFLYVIIFQRSNSIRSKDFYKYVTFDLSLQRDQWQVLSS